MPSASRRFASSCRLLWPSPRTSRRGRSVCGARLNEIFYQNSTKTLRTQRSQTRTARSIGPVVAAITDDLDGLFNRDVAVTFNNALGTPYGLDRILFYERVARTEAIGRLLGHLCTAKGTAQLVILQHVGIVFGQLHPLRELSRVLLLLVV